MSFYFLLLMFRAAALFERKASLPAKPSLVSTVNITKMPERADTQVCPYLPKNLSGEP